MTKKMQLFGLFICTQSALHVSDDVFVHHQEHLLYEGNSKSKGNFQITR